MHSTKRSLLAIVLMLTMLVPCFAMTSCGDDEIDGVIEFDFNFFVCLTKNCRFAIFT